MNVHPPPCVTWHVSCILWHASPVTCQVSPVRFQVSGIKCHIFFLLQHVCASLGGSVINGPTPSSFVLQTALLLIKWLSESSVVKISSQHPHSQTVGARYLKFWENVHLPPSVMCHLSCVMRHMSHVTCEVSHVTFFFFFFSDILVKLVGGTSVVNVAYLFYTNEYIC